MRNGRGPNRDHDQKSVEPLKQRTKMIKPTLNTHAAKACAHCERSIACYDRTKHGDLDKRGVLSLAREDLLGFDHDRNSATGFQSWCKQCKDEWEHRPASIFSRTRSFLITEEPGSWSEWEACSGGALAEFMRKWDQNDGLCHYCEAGLRQWQVSGHVLDRIDNKIRRHTPGNTTLCCWPCNHSKGDKSPFAWEMELAPYLEKYGPGCVPHGARSDRYKQVEIRSTRHLIVDDGGPALPPREQMGLAL